MKFSFLNFYQFSRLIFLNLNFSKKKYKKYAYDIASISYHDVINLNSLLMYRYHSNLNKFKLLSEIFKNNYYKKIFSPFINFLLYKKEIKIKKNYFSLKTSSFSSLKLINNVKDVKDYSYFSNSFLKIITKVQYNLKFIKFCLKWINLKFFQFSFFFYLKNFFSFSNNLNWIQNNFFANNSFHIILKKKIIKLFNYNQYPCPFTLWQSLSFIKFMEFYSGSKIMVKIFYFLNYTLTYEDHTRCLIWFKRLKFFQKLLGTSFFLLESVQILYLSLKIKDPFFLINWLTHVLHKISFWKLRSMFHFLQYIFKYCLGPIFKNLGVKGIKFQLKGKVSVGGNSRTRYIICYEGETGAATYKNRVLYALKLVRSFTGIMGLRIWLVF